MAGRTRRIRGSFIDESDRDDDVNEDAFNDMGGRPPQDHERYTSRAAPDDGSAFFLTGRKVAAFWCVTARSTSPLTYMHHVASWNMVFFSVGPRAARWLTLVRGDRRSVSASTSLKSLF